MWPKDVAERALVNSGRHCCLCHKFCGFKIELHHIIQRSEGGADTDENCIPLCLECHAEVKAYDPGHPIGRKYNASELREHRDRWYEKVKNSHGITANPEYLEIDRGLFREIRQLLPDGGSAMYHLRYHDYRGVYRRAEHDELYVFRNRCQSPDFEFMDVDLEALRVRLAEQIDEFLDFIARKACGVEGMPDLELLRAPAAKDLYRMMSIYAVATDDAEVAKLVHESMQEHLAVAEQANSLASEIWATYEELVRLGRRKLAV